MDALFIQRYFKGELSETEEKVLLDWINESEENHKEFLQQRKLWDIFLLNASDDAELGVKRGKERHAQRGRTLWVWEMAKIAAVFLVAMGIGIALKPHLTFKKEPVAYNKIEVPIGQRVCLTLCDGSKVWLNAKTHFRFPEKFEKNQRTVYLDGEAMFEVTHNEKAPFYVKTSKYNVKVLGTKFNVYAYNNSNSFETTLVNGKVMLTRNNTSKVSVVLKPNQQMIYDHHSDKTIVRTVKTAEYTTWIDGYYSFDNEKFESIVQRLERYYEAKIVVNYPELMDYKFTGKFRYSDPLTVILDVVKKNKPFKYQKVNDEIFITK